MTQAIQTIGFVGLGNMGRPMTARLVKKGYAVLGSDASAQAMRDAAAAGVTPFGGPLDELARASDAVVLMLPNSDVVRAVMMGRDGRKGLIDGLSAGDVVIDMSSSSPVETKALGATLAERSIRMLDAPVSGNVSKAITGELSIMVGGEAASLDRVRPMLEAMGSRIIHVGPLGAGHAIKALNNLVSASGLIAAAEALIIGTRFGLEPEIMLDVFNVSTGRNNSTENKFKQFVLSRRFDGGFYLALMAKDLTIALDLARTTDTPAVHSAVTRELVQAAKRNQPADADHTAVVRWLEELADVKLELLKRQ